jgi:hypothetical protein
LRGEDRIISLFGSYSPVPGDALYEQAYQLGFGLASAGYVVANGGYDGTMEASAKGAKDAGGTTLGVTCNIFSDYRGKPLEANGYIDHEIAHDQLLDRIEALRDMSAGFVFLEGGTGTLCEFGIVWEFVAKKLMAPRPIFVLGDFWRPMVDRILSVRPKHGQHVHCFDSVDALVDKARELIPAGVGRQ